KESSHGISTTAAFKTKNKNIDSSSSRLDIRKSSIPGSTEVPPNKKRKGGPTSVAAFSDRIEGKNLSIAITDFTAKFRPKYSVDSTVITLLFPWVQCAGSLSVFEQLRHLGKSSIFPSAAEHSMMLLPDSRPSLLSAIADISKDTLD